MRTVEGFTAVCRDIDRRTVRLLNALVVAGVSPMLIVVALWDWIERWAGGPVALAAALLPLFALVVWGEWQDRKAQWATHGDCPGCGRLLVGRRPVRQRVIATRHCPHCQTRVLPDPDPPTAATLLPLAAVEAAEKAGERRMMWWFYGSFGTLLAGPAAATAVGVGQTRGLFARLAHDPVSAAALEATALVVCGFVPFAVGMTAFLVRYRRAEQHPAVRCPHCGGRLSLSVPVLRDTGNCGHCGRRAVALPESPPAG